MFWCGKQNKQQDGNAGAPNGAESAGSENRPDEGRAPRSMWRRLAAPAIVIGGFTVGHAPVCAVVATALAAAGVVGVREFCGHSADRTPPDVTLDRLSTVPTRYHEFSDPAAAQAAARILDAQPGLHAAIAAKREEAEGAEIQIVVVENEDDGCVVVGLCKNGMLCPCSKPQFYNIGSRNALMGSEAFPGQHHILRALYETDGSRR